MTTVNTVPGDLTTARVALHALRRAKDDLDGERSSIEAARSQLSNRENRAAAAFVYPNWRAVDFGKDIERVDGMDIGTRMFAMLGKLKGVEGVALEFRGEDKSIAFFGHAGDANVRGLIMPRRRA